MPVPVVLACGLVTAVVLIGGRSLLSLRDAVDVERPERWIVAHAPRWLAGLLRSLDRRVVGGAMVGVFFVVISAAALGVGWVLSGTDGTDEPPQPSWRHRAAPGPPSGDSIDGALRLRCWSPADPLVFVDTNSSIRFDWPTSCRPASATGSSISVF